MSKVAYTIVRLRRDAPLIDPLATYELLGSAWKLDVSFAISILPSFIQKLSIHLIRQQVISSHLLLLFIC